MNQSTELPEGFKQELQMYSDYRNFPGHISNPRDITNIILRRLIRNDIITDVNQLAITERLRAEERKCTKAHLDRRLSDLRKVAMLGGPAIDNKKTLVQQARSAYFQWFKTLAKNGYTEYEVQPEYVEIFSLEEEIFERLSKPKIPATTPDARGRMA